jgi:hypothetical protein
MLEMCQQKRYNYNADGRLIPKNMIAPCCGNPEVGEQETLMGGKGYDLTLQSRRAT